MHMMLLKQQDTECRIFHLKSKGKNQRNLRQIQDLYPALACLLGRLIQNI